MSGDLRVAYRASAEGDRDIVSVSHASQIMRSFPSCRYIQGWFDAMTSLGRLIFFEQPGTAPSRCQTTARRLDDDTLVEPAVEAACPRVAASESLPLVRRA